ncbi:uncharacterized protein SPPG_08365 [Spizellomyces punctatus DAOM BR117]|uniref:Mitochondrial carrier protein n=1 Tax=Spizellomyces punctatus (strain DAOM BR117) TaxID=645134 RepID=A0A0L0H4T2_SPIPD|nr:uncharacterized protein SPPG_08365 [Spizellomyces punctatus DAOM BR117]KNC96212.1 hypothetical protein SPPG_08365 [Spizellomyces punctatus DAOM BR117]|eukprot:XP_016604252.1 hypothetical protein SPPG_08365 [Spizellomyces punctatus DAOM BR117]
MAEPMESAFATDVHGHSKLGVDFAAGIVGGVREFWQGIHWYAFRNVQDLRFYVCSTEMLTADSWFLFRASLGYNKVSVTAFVGVSVDRRAVILTVWPIVAFQSTFAKSGNAREERVYGLYKGMASPLVGVAVINSLLFGVYGFFLRHLGPGENAVWSIFLAGSASGAVNAFFSCPMELVKIRLQNQRSTSTLQGQIPIYKGPLDCMRQIYRTNGLRGFYRGLACTLWRETPSYGAYFASYEILCRMMLPEDAPTNEPSPKLLFAGGLAGVVAWLVTYPFDVVKTRLQSVEQETKPLYKGTFHCMRTIIRSEGWGVLFSGWGATAIRAFPTNAATFYAVCWAKNILNNLGSDDG